MDLGGLTSGNGQEHRPGYKILADGSEIAANQRVIAIRVKRSINRIPEAEIVFHDGDVSTTTFELSSKSDFDPGKEIEIKAGYGGDYDTIFKGVVVKHAVKVGAGGLSTLVVTLKHKVFVSTLSRKNAVYMDKADSDIMEELLGNTGVSKDVTTTSTQHKQMMQFNCTDWDFINMRAEANNMIIIAGDKEVKIASPQSMGTSSLKLAFGSTLIEADIEMDGRVCFSDFKAQTWSPSEQKVEEYSSSAAPQNELGSLSSSTISSDLSIQDFVIHNGGAQLEADITAAVNIYKTRAALSKIKGTVKCNGKAGVEPGDLLGLDGLGDKFKGDAFINGVLHEIAGGNWETWFELGLDEVPYAERYDNIIEKPGGNVVAGINGLQIGIVSKITDDPDGEFRVLVKIPIASADDDAVWARVARLDAGDKRGIIFHPEEKDEVILGFINDDPRQAVILGMLHSSKLAVPDDLKPADKNPKKGIITRERMQLIFDDDKKIITVLAEKGTIVIDDDKKSITIKDKNENEWVMDDKGIAVTSKKDFKVKAQGDIKMEGNNIEFKAQAKLTAEGSAGTTVKSSAITEVKGSMVNIN